MILLDPNDNYYSLKPLGKFDGNYPISRGSEELTSLSLVLPETSGDIFSSVGLLSVFRERTVSEVDRVGRISPEELPIDEAILRGLPGYDIMFKLHLKSGLPVPVVYSLISMLIILVISFFTVKYFGETILFVVILIFMIFAAALSRQIVGLFEVVMFLIIGVALLISNQEIIQRTRGSQ